MALSILQREHWFAPSHFPFLMRHLSQALHTRLRMPRGEFGEDDSVGRKRMVAGGIAFKKDYWDCDISD
jgi:hypothetical protein